MLKITEQTPTKLVLQDQQLFATLSAGLITVVSALSLVSLAIQGIDSLILHDDRDFIPIRLAGFAVFLLVGGGFLVLGIGAFLHFWNGITCVFDKEAEEMRLQNMGLFRKKEQSWSIYSISHLDAELNEEIRVYGLFIVLRSNERIPIASLPMIEQEHAEHLKKQIRSFLRS